MPALRHQVQIVIILLTLHKTGGHPQVQMLPTKRDVVRKDQHGSNGGQPRQRCLIVGEVAVEVMKHGVASRRVVSPPDMQAGRVAFQPIGVFPIEVHPLAGPQCKGLQDKRTVRDEVFFRLAKTVNDVVPAGLERNRLVREIGRIAWAKWVATNTQEQPGGQVGKDPGNLVRPLMVGVYDVEPLPLGKNRYGLMFPGKGHGRGGQKHLITEPATELTGNARFHHRTPKTMRLLSHRRHVLSIYGRAPRRSQVRFVLTPVAHRAAPLCRIPSPEHEDTATDANMMYYRQLLVFASTAILLATGRGGRAEYVRGEINGWAAVSPMSADASFGNVWKATLTSGSDVSFSEYKFDRYGDNGWTENWGEGSSAVKNLSPGGLANGGGNLSFSRLNGKRYSFQMAADHASHVLMETDADPVGITGVSDDHASSGLGPVQVSITLSAPRSAQENIYVRYATNMAFPSSWLAAATGSGANVVANLPAFATGTRVYYYILSSTLPTGQILAASDLCTLRGKNAGTSNFAYEVSGSSFTGVVPTTEFTETNAAQWGQLRARGLRANDRQQRHHAREAGRGFHPVRHPERLRHRGALSRDQHFALGRLLLHPPGILGLCHQHHHLRLPGPAAHRASHQPRRHPHLHTRRHSDVQQRVAPLPHSAGWRRHVDARQLGGPQPAQCDAVGDPARHVGLRLHRVLRRPAFRKPEPHQPAARGPAPRRPA
jgi:hypothetical protein